jgi:CheY-like chemotaxis protein
MTVRVLIVDDNVEFLRAARGLLQREGITVVAVASTCAEALRSAEAHNPDVVPVDVDLGDENGFDVAERLSRPTGRPRPVALISAHPEQDLEDLIYCSPAIGFISKSRLSVNAIVSLLDRGAGPAERDRASGLRET